MPRLGVIGSLVWDTIHLRDPGRTEPVREWGGIAYALSAFEAAAPDEWTMFPIFKLGSDLREQAFRFLRGFERIDSLDGVRPVPEAHNRVELVYDEGGRRTERLRGGVPGWTWEELAPLARACDALYVNFIAGWEMELATARLLRRDFEGPLYADLHSLLLRVGPGGMRLPRQLEQWREWIECFDIVQLNEDELGRMSESWGDPWRLAAAAVGPATPALLVTLAERGAAWITVAGFDRLSARPSTAPGAMVRSGPAVSGIVPGEQVGPDADPTGCGDVWGMTCFVSLLGGYTLTGAMRRANALAARNAGLRGASGLARRLDPGGSVLLPRHDEESFG